MRDCMDGRVTPPERVTSPTLGSPPPCKQALKGLKTIGPDGSLRSRRLPPGGGYSHTLPIRVCAAQRGRDFEAPDLERGIHFRGVF